MLRGGRNVHIGLIMDAAVYANFSAKAYARPTEPGTYAQHGPGDSTAPRADDNAIHKEGIRIYEIDKNLYDALKQDIIAAVEDTYLSTKFRGTWGFTESPPRTSWTI